MKFCYHCMQQIQDEKLNQCPYCGKSLQAAKIPDKFLKPGTVLQGKFLLGYPLGAGGFGNTYIGWDGYLLRRVAIKEFYPEQYSGRAVDGVTVTVANASMQPRFQNGLKQFLEEARNVAALQDIKGVVEISSFFEQNGTGYIVMEYLEGMDVRNILKRSGNRKDYEWCRRVVLTVLHTLREIHKRDVLHRDIAPDNIFVTKEGVIKLIDFGAAKHASALTNMGSDIVLKVGYAPIEQYSQNAPQGPYTDLYAVAALFYRMLTGQKPIPANERIQHDTLVPPSELGVSLPEQAEMGIMVCLNLKPEHRLQSAEEFMEVLDGKNFFPIYEPKWILSAAEENQKGRQNSSGSSPALKAVICLGVIGLAVALTVCGILLSRGGSQTAEVMNTQTRDGQVKLEDYTGQAYADVSAELEQLGFVPEMTYDFSDEPEGIIIEQSIAPSTNIEVEKNKKITFVVSGGQSKYTMPDFSGWTEEQIAQYFAERNFDVKLHTDPYDIKIRHIKENIVNQPKRAGKITIKRMFSKKKKRGICYKQSVKAGKMCKTAENLSFLVSMGGKESDFIKKVPDFSGLSPKQVKRKLKKKKLAGILKVTYKKSGGYSRTVPAGAVLAQSIPAGKKVNIIKNKGKKIKLSLSQGAAPKPTSMHVPSNRTVFPHTKGIGMKVKSDTHHVHGY